MKESSVDGRPLFNLTCQTSIKLLAHESSVLLVFSKFGQFLLLASHWQYMQWHLHGSRPFRSHPAGERSCNIVITLCVDYLGFIHNCITLLGIMMRGRTPFQLESTTIHGLSQQKIELSLHQRARRLLSHLVLHR